MGLWVHKLKGRGGENKEFFCPAQEGGGQTS